ncbi:diguanylate cyclase (GGDEF) domain-containing protein [Thiorhodovibrio frisius]|uniref:diguanylate cyclase n=2 Tax=Thiorhodovibrio frisius TaxID=631362 RepID=H8Z0V5_9GAMM|nr:diguanylate cyclase (GGDEF) domain-containing protein [Thiorhodovibrio frisius]WPL23920.1 Stalked cell differentiation-controlling protein [Thiorhodovibrio frisius]
MGMVLPKLTQKLCYDMAVWMIGLGLTIGLLFPPMMHWLGFPTEEVYSSRFMLACLTAGLMMAVANFLVARWVVAPRLRRLSSQARQVEAAIRRATDTNDWHACTPEKCQLTVDSADEIGEIGRSFNDLVDALLLSHAVEAAVNEFVHRLTGKLELEPMSEEALDRLIEHTQADAGAVIVEQAGELTLTALRGIQGLSDPSAYAPIRHCLKSNSQVTVTLPEDISIDAVLTRFRPRQLVLIPLAFKGVPLGLFLLARAHEFSQHAHRMMTLFQQSFALALNNAQAHHQLQHLVVIDPLTGLYNRRFGMARLSEEFQRATRGDAALSLLMLDIDHFKDVNDTHGHLIGDRVLIEVAQTLKGLSREGDIVLRYGGEEFLMLLPGATNDSGRILAERICHAIADQVVETAQLRLQVTISIGLACFPDQDAETPEALIALADRALYQAKEAGRNRVQTCMPAQTRQAHSGRTRESKRLAAIS